MYWYRALACILALLGFAVASPASLAQDKTKFVYYFTPSSNVAPVGRRAASAGGSAIVRRCPSTPTINSSPTFFREISLLRAIGSLSRTRAPEVTTGLNYAGYSAR